MVTNSEAQRLGEDRAEKAGPLQGELGGEGRPLLRPVAEDPVSSPRPVVDDLGQQLRNILAPPLRVTENYSQRQFRSKATNHLTRTGVIRKIFLFIAGLVPLHVY
jgi:hypothetical protein